MTRPTAADGGVARHAFPVMGTVCSVVVARADVRDLGAADLAATLAQVRKRLEEYEQRFSHYRADSDIERWLRGEAVEATTEAEIRLVLARCEELSADSGGVFSATDPRTGATDTAGFVKGYAIAGAADVMLQRGIRSFTLGIGGDVVAHGRPDATRPWRVAIQDPRSGHAIAAIVDLLDQAVATSGRAHRGDHIWLGSGPALPPFASLTVIGPDISLADAYATIGYAMGVRGPAWVTGHDGYHCLVVRDDGSVDGDAPSLVRPSS